MVGSKTMVLRVLSAQPDALRTRDGFQGSCFFPKNLTPLKYGLQTHPNRLKPKFLQILLLYAAIVLSNYLAQSKTIQQKYQKPSAGNHAAIVAGFFW